MTAALNLERARAAYAAMKDAEALAPLTGPAESLLLDSNGSVIRIHRMIGSLNAALNVLGLYHAVTRERGTRDLIFDPPLRSSRLDQARRVLAP